MSYPNDAPAAAWYPDPQTSGQVRWWDGTNWTEHVSKPAVDNAAQATVAAVETTGATGGTVAQTVAEQLAAPAPAQPDFAGKNDTADEHIAAVNYIGRHAAGATPVPRKASTAPRIRPRVRAQVHTEAQVEARVEALAYA
ncbi:hypothetical protein BH10ACT6_BH10ACT6_10550 [soil metagenome]